MQAPVRPPQMRQGRRRRAGSAAAPGALLAFLVLVAGACSSGGSKHVLPSGPTPASTTTTLFATSTSSSSTTTTTPVATTTTSAVRVVDLSGCPPDNPDADRTELNAGPDLARDLVPIDALNVRICTYGPAKSRPHLLGISWLALSEAAAFTSDTNKLTAAGQVTSTTRADITCTARGQDSTSYLLTFAVDTQTVNVSAAGCPPTVSNGTLTAPATAEWYGELARYASHPAPVAKAP